MIAIHSSKKGFTLLETVFSLILLALVWVAAANVIIVNKMSGSFARHKAQAINVARRAIEDARKKSFVSIIGGTTNVSIDTRGTPDDYSDDFIGTQVMTVTDLGNHKRVIVEVSWNEIFFGTTRTIREYCGTFIGNDPQVN